MTPDAHVALALAATLELYINVTSDAHVALALAATLLAATLEL